MWTNFGRRTRPLDGFLDGLFLIGRTFELTDVDVDVDWLKWSESFDRIVVVSFCLLFVISGLYFNQPYNFFSLKSGNWTFQINFIFMNSKQIDCWLLIQKPSNGIERHKSSINNIYRDFMMINKKKNFKFFKCFLTNCFPWNLVYWSQLKMPVRSMTSWT